jgi:hypothetical protein
MALLLQPCSGCILLLVSLFWWLLCARLTGLVCLADRAYSLLRSNSELIASVALIIKCDVHLPTLFLRVFLDFALRSQRLARRSLSECSARQCLYGLVDALGLGGVLSILVGSAFIRGISCRD